MFHDSHFQCKHLWINKWLALESVIPYADSRNIRQAQDGSEGSVGEIEWEMQRVVRGDEIGK